VVHGHEDAGEERNADKEGEVAAERPTELEVGGGGKNEKGKKEEPADRQPPLHPSHECALRLVGRMSAHDRILQKKSEASADPDLGVWEEFERPADSPQPPWLLPATVRGELHRSRRQADTMLSTSLFRASNAGRGT